MNRTLKGILFAGLTGVFWGLTTLATKLIGKAGLPIGLQIVAAPHKEWELLQFAQAYESVTNFIAKCPPKF